MKGFIERALLVVETFVLGYQVVELPHILAITIGVVVAVMATVVIVARHTGMLNGIRYDEEHTHAGAAISNKVHNSKNVLRAKHDRSRYF